MRRNILLVIVIGLLALVVFFLINKEQVGKFLYPSPVVMSPGNLSAVSRAATVSGIFEATTPCSREKRPLPQILATVECEMTLWRIMVNSDFTYTLDASYGMSQAGTTGIKGGGTKIAMEGNWSFVRGTKANPAAEVMQLHTEGPEVAASFLIVSNNLIHLLDSDKNLMVGNGGWSYTLSRTDNKKTSTSGIHITSSSVVDEVSSGVFEGRVPCIDSILTLYNITKPGCQRIKVKLTLHGSKGENIPAIYQLQNIYVGKGDTQHRGAGTWTTMQGTKTDPNALVYQLKPNNSQQVISLLKVDDNHLFFLDEYMEPLVGNALLSYTLSRTAIEIPTK